MSLLAPTLVIATGAVTAANGQLILANASTGAFTVTLPLARDAYGHAPIRVKKMDSSINAVTVARAGTALIDGAATYLLDTQYKSVQLVSDGSNWHVVGYSKNVDFSFVARSFRPGAYWAPSGLTSGDTAGTLTQSVEYAVRFDVATQTTFDRIGLEVTTAVAATTVRLGIRSDTGGLYPGSLILDAGTIDSATTGFKELIVSQLLGPGRYWLSATAQGGAGVGVRVRGLDPLLGQSATGLSNIASYAQTGITGALPAAFSSTFTPAGAGVKILMRAA